MATPVEPLAPAQPRPPDWARGWRLRVVGAVAALIFEAIFIGSYVGSLHDPKPRWALPIGVVAPAQLASGLVQQIGAQAARVVHPRVEAEEAALRDAIDDLEVYGAWSSARRGPS